MIKEKQRLTKNCKINCYECRLGKHITNDTDYRSELMDSKPELYVSIIKQWSEECPAKTYLQQLTEILPHMSLNSEGLPQACPSSFNIYWNDIDGCTMDEGWDKCQECWNQTN